MWLMYAVLAAVGFGLRGVFYHWMSQKPVNRNLLLCGTFAMGAVLNLVCAVAAQSEWTAACLIGVQMGLFSFSANASMFKGFAVGKASLVAVLTALPSVVVVLAAYLLWNEQVTGMQLAAFAVIIAGVLLVRYSSDLSLRNLQGAHWGLLAMLLFAANDLSGKWSTIMEAPLFPTMVCMFVTGTICFGLWWLSDLRKERATAAGLSVSETSAASEAPAGEPLKRRPAGPWSPGRTFAVGMAIGTTNAVGMMLIVTAFELGKAGLVSAVVALNVLIILFYTRFVVKEKFKPTELAGIVVALAGMILMRLF